MLFMCLCEIFNHYIIHLCIIIISINSCPNKCHRCLSDMLGALLHLQHHGCDLHKADEGLSARRYSLYRHFLAGLHEQLCKSSNIHCVQPRIP